MGHVVLLPVQVSEPFLQAVFSAIEANPATQFLVDLEAQRFTIQATGQSAGFEIDPYKKTCMINGYDDIDFLLNLREEIEAFEQKNS